MNEVQEITENKDAQVFAEAVVTVEFGRPLYMELTKHFANEMYKAIKGRICTPERMALLYPIFREINIEMGEINEYCEKERRKFKKKEERKDEGIS